MSDGEALGEGLLELAVRAAAEAATLVAARRSGGVRVSGTKSSDVDIVTEVDTECERLLRSLVLTARPEDGFLGEEGDDVIGSSGVRWIADPIDGTVNFLYGLPQYAVSLAAEVDGEVVAGVVVNPATGVAYRARRGGGAWRWQGPAASKDARPERLEVRGAVPVAERLVLTGFNYEAHIRRIQAAAAASLLPRVRDIRRLGACALDLCHVAEGAADGYVEEGVELWDHAAGALIAEEAGARSVRTVGRGGKAALVCAPETGFDDFWALVRDAGFLAEGE
ncbi:inositol monophosphatase family protein [Nocardioides alcanivorans]|uniref:inositol monophosphatase family protein n=1 Tax=Nocardioides alcanivorans TaxID=2897352 RepID=UPI001F1F6C27|nr:inositol monophosphatase family protein [Nocardioides alcanivorans]